MNEKAKERFFSIELKSKANLKNVTLTNESQDVFIEGSLGKLQRAEFSENIILEVFGNKGVLRINLSPHDIKQQENQVKRKANE